jgi:nucleoside-diphosphate-sugar epimerase
VKRCVITGGSGLIGAHLIASIHQQWQICAIARTRPTSRLCNVETQCIDLTKAWDTEALPRTVEAVIHLAQSEQFRAFPEQAEQVWHMHTVSTLRLLDYARRAGAHTFILASSGGVYGYGAQAFSEDMPVARRGALEFYLGTRLCSEIMAESYTPFMNVMVLRFFFVYGPGQRRSMLIPRLVQAVIDSTPITLHGPAGICVNPTYVADAATAVQRALDLQGSHTINIGGPDVLSLRQIGDIIGTVVGKVPRFEVQPLSQPRHLVGDISKMARLLGRPRIDFATGMRTYVDSLERSV